MLMVIAAVTVPVEAIAQDGWAQYGWTQDRPQDWQRPAPRNPYRRNYPTHLGLTMPVPMILVQPMPFAYAPGYRGRRWSGRYDRRRTDWVYDRRNRYAYDNQPRAVVPPGYSFAPVPGPGAPYYGPAGSYGAGYGRWVAR